LRYLQLLRQGPVPLLWGAQTLSVLGDRVYAMAVMWIAWEQAGAAAMGFVAIAESVPYILLGTFGRQVVDRFASLRGLAYLDLVRAVLVVALPWTWTTFGTTGLLVSAAMLGVCGALFDPNLGALVPDLVEPDQVQAVNGLMDLTGRIARVAGPGSAGILLAAMPMSSLFWLDGATFAVSAVALTVLARRISAYPRTAKTSATRDVQDVGGPAPDVPTSVRAPRAWTLLRRHPDTATMMGVHSLGIFAAAVSMAMPALLATRLDAGAGTYGTVLAVIGGGSLIGNAVAGNVRLPRLLPAVYCGFWAVSGVLLAMTGAVVSLPMLLVVSAGSGVVAPFLSIALSTHLAAFPPPARRRLLTVDQTLIRTAGTLSMLVLPAAAAADPAVGFLIGGSATAVVGLGGCALVIWRSRTRTPIPLSVGVAETVSPALSPAGRG
jgi:MFS transporter